MTPLKNKGIALILIFAVILVLTILGATIITRSISENKIAKSYLESAQAFWLAEAGINRALNELRASYSTSGHNLWLTTLPQGQYLVDIELDNQKRNITAYGYVPSKSSPRVTRILQSVLEKAAPAHFYENAIYAAGNIEMKGTVNGSVRYAGNITGGVGTEIYDPAISPLALLDFDQLRIISKAQGNYDLKNRDFPTTFWKSPGVPNVVFLEHNLELKGNDLVGGFFVVGGNVAYDATIAGTSSVDGCIYTRGNFTINGGGGAAFNIKGVWVGGSTKLGGSSIVTYDAEYMAAIQALGININVQVDFWRDPQGHYPVTN